MSGSPFSFDRQAEAWSDRAALPDAAVERWVDAVVDAAAPDSALGAPRAVLDLGAGSGGLGAALRPALARRCLEYVGLDLSFPMLRLFRGVDGAAALVRADARRGWPLADGSVLVLLASRAAHLFAAEALVAEALRVLAPGGAMLVGGVRRSRDSVTAELRRELHRRLEARGVEAVRRGRRWRQLDLGFSRAGCRVETRTLAGWSTRVRPRQPLERWREKDGLAGRSVPRAIKSRILQDLERWAQSRYGDLDEPRATEEQYETLIVKRP
ncbi:MAG: methyltransferase domain-containing protein [Acidobacteriota bacterium]